MDPLTFPPPAGSGYVGVALATASAVAASDVSAARMEAAATVSATEFESSASAVRKHCDPEDKGTGEKKKMKNI